MFASLATLAAIAALATVGTAHAGREGGVGCTFGTATHELSVTLDYDDANGGVIRNGDDIVVEDVFGPLGCAGAEGPTSFNADLVRVRGRAASVDDLTFELNLMGGPFAPGFSDEGDGSSEVEFVLSLGSTSRIPISASGGADRIVLGDLARGQGANLNAAEVVDDPDVTVGRGTFLVYGRDGADVISARGGGGFIGPYHRSMFAVGDRGDDLLAGGPKRDYLIGGRGHDTMSGGGAGDLLLARDDTREMVNCGPGSDVAKVDRIDRLHGCEDVRRKGSPG